MWFDVKWRLIDISFFVIGYYDVAPGKVTSRGCADGGRIWTIEVIFLYLRD
jgi:hypothetical protein